MQNPTILRAVDPEQPPETFEIYSGSDNECYTTSPNQNTGNQRWEDAWLAQSPQAQQPVIDRFWASVDRTEKCWVCRLGAGDAFGHAQFNFRLGEKQYRCYAHRFAWMITHGDPTGSFVLHHCDNPPCVRDEHLFLGDQDANMKDAASKARLIGPLKLSNEAYQEIITAPFTYGSGRALAVKYGVDPVSISRIRHGKQGDAWRRRHGYSCSDSTSAIASEVAR